MRGYCNDGNVEDHNGPDDRLVFLQEMFQNYYLEGQTRNGWYDGRRRNRLLVINQVMFKMEQETRKYRSIGGPSRATITVKNCETISKVIEFLGDMGIAVSPLENPKLNRWVWGPPGYRLVFYAYLIDACNLFLKIKKRFRTSIVDQWTEPV